MNEAGIGFEGEKIKILPPKVAELIAAGEVIERPASVVKELVENSIDAQADEIVIHVKGSDYIAVFDNGEGMNEKDAILSVQKHATSKISTEKDLERIYTFGFRGEALHSIALVSKLTIRTKQRKELIEKNKNNKTDFEIVPNREKSTKAEDDLGVEITVEGGKIKEVKKVYIDGGTQVIVKDLFYNTPARKKFLSSEKVEFSYVIDVVSRFTLAFPNISIKLLKDGVAYMSLRKFRTLDETIEILFGNKSLQEPRIEILFSVGDVGIEGFIWRKKVGVGRWIFVNKRYVKDKTIMGAVSRFEFLKNSDYILFINTPPEFYDVNVNPTKTEIRWRTPAKIREIVITAIEDGLRHSLKNAFKGNQSEIRVQEHPLQEQKRKEVEVSKQQQEEEKSRYEEKVFPSSFLLPSAPKILSVIYGIFAIVEWQGETYIVDLHAYHEGKILAELKSKFSEKQKAEKMKFVIPFEFEVSSSTAEKIKDKIDEFAEIGIEFEIDGKKIKVFSIPFFLSGVDLSEFFEEFQDGISDKKLDEFLGKIACRRAIRKGDKINTWEIMSILDNFDPSVRCAHGRPSAIKLVEEELEKKFGRC